MYSTVMRDRYVKIRLPPQLCKIVTIIAMPQLLLEYGDLCDSLVGFM